MKARLCPDCILQGAGNYSVFQEDNAGDCVKSIREVKKTTDKDSALGHLRDSKGPKMSMEDRRQVRALTQRHSTRR